VDILLRRSDLERARLALEGAGFVYRQVASLGQPGAWTCFWMAQGECRDAVHIVFAQEKVRGQSAPSPDVAESEAADQFRLITLEALVRMKLAAFREQGSHAPP
jgi:hypothetical protein